MGAALGECLRVRVDDRHVARSDAGLSQQAVVDLKDDFLPDCGGDWASKTPSGSPALG